MKNLNILTPLFALLIAGTAGAQELHKDINVEQEINPLRRDAARISVLPTVSLTPVAVPHLDYSSKVVTTRVPNSFTVLEPVAWGDKIYVSPYRGYVNLGIGASMAIGDLSAGYRILDNDKSRLSLWGQYNGDIYKREEFTWHDHTASLGLDLHQAVGGHSFIDAGADYTYGFHDMAAFKGGRFSQSTSRGNASATFSSRVGGLDYFAGLHYGHFGYYNPHFPKSMISTGNILIDPYNGYEPARQNLIGLNLGGKLDTGATSSVALDVDADFLSTGKHYNVLLPYGEDDASLNKSRTTGLITLSPRFESHNNDFTLRIGADVDFSVNSGKTIRVAPDVTLAWHSMQFFGIELRAYGGSSLNTLASLYDYSPYMNGSVAYNTSHTPYAFDAKIAFGPFLGGTVELFGGYAKADDMLLPVVSEIFPAGGVWESVDIKGYRYGARLGYDNGKTFSVSASYEGSPSKWNRTWIDNRDRAKHIISAQLKLRPIEKVNVTIGYELRAGRCTYIYQQTPSQVIGMDVYYNERVSLGTVSNLSLGAAYKFTEKLSFFLQGENLLGRKSLYIGGRPMQGVNGMIGAALKF